MDPELLPGSGSGTRKIQSWIRIRNKSIWIHNTALNNKIWTVIEFYNLKLHLKFFPKINHFHQILASYPAGSWISNQQKRLWYERIGIGWMSTGTRTANFCNINIPFWRVMLQAYSIIHFSEPVSTPWDCLFKKDFCIRRNSSRGGTGIAQPSRRVELSGKLTANPFYNWILDKILNFVSDNALKPLKFLKRSFVQYTPQPPPRCTGTSLPVLVKTIFRYVCRCVYWYLQQRNCLQNSLCFARPQKTVQ